MKAWNVIDLHLTQLLTTIERKTIAGLMADRETVVIGPFLATFDRATDLIWCNYAVPLGEYEASRLTESMIAQLQMEFQQRGRTLRFEYHESLHPELAGVIEGAGLRLQVAAPMMICSPATLRPIRAGCVCIESLGSSNGEEDVHEYLRLTRRCFAMENEIQPAEITEHHRKIGIGAYRCALARIDGIAVGVGILVATNDELCGVGILPDYRRRGVAATLSSFLVEEHFQSGSPLVWLSAGDEIARATYARIGFTDAGRQLHYIDGAAQQG